MGKARRIPKKDDLDSMDSENEMQMESSEEQNDSSSEYEDLGASDASFDDDENDDEQVEDDGEADELENSHRNDEELEELEKEYRDLQNMEQNLIQTIKHDKEEDVNKGQAVKNQKALWNKALELRFSLQKAFSNANRLPQEPVRSLFCQSDEEVSAAYSELIDSSKKTINALVELEEALLKNNASITQAVEANLAISSKTDPDNEDEWFQISEMQSRISEFRNKSVDKWHRKAQVNTGASGKFNALNQNISDQVTMYMRDPSKMLKGMQSRRETVGVFGSFSVSVEKSKEERIQADGDPELLDDSDFYQRLLKEFFETVDPNSSETAFYAIKRMQTKKRKIVDRRASKGRKIRYHVHEKIVNFMAPQPMNLPPTAPKLFENLFGLKTAKALPS